jgi:ribosome-associated toxin RatA of RatAB toxin-antitoxin module
LFNPRFFWKENFKAQWTFDAIDDETTDLNFEMEYEISNKLLEFVFNKNLKVVSDSIIRAFELKLVN